MFLQEMKAALVPVEMSAGVLELYTCSNVDCTCIVGITLPVGNLQFCSGNNELSEDPNRSMSY
jgi:hypothetical protein